ncbi:hypothetical protein MCHIJ_50320 [Mycolicibacterium chitae]|nr:hypothetical protein MCHIJ_50320 [Mycolicibacterium chitae]
MVALDVDVVTPTDQPLHRRLLTISDTVEHWMDTHRPDVVAIERVFSNHNANTAMGTGQAGGVIALAAARRDIDVHFHTPSEVKAAVTGNGRADKAQVTTMVTRILELQQKPTPRTRRRAGTGHLPLLAGPDDRADGRGGGDGGRAAPQVPGHAQGENQS